MEEKYGTGGKALPVWSFLFTLMWVLSRVLSRCFLQAGPGESLLELFNAAPEKMYPAGAVLLLEACSVCGVLIFSFRNLKCFRNGESFRKSFLECAAAALLCEIPYDLLMTGRPFSAQLQNPALGLLNCRILLYFLNRYEKGGTQNVLIRGAVILAAAGWTAMLHIQYGIPFLICTVVLWLFRKHPDRVGFAGMTAGALCILCSPFFLAAPMGAMILHFRGTEEVRPGGMAAYLTYPALFLLGALTAGILPNLV